MVPQTLNDQGIVQGHQHVTVQYMQDIQFLDPTKFYYFEGLNSQADSGNILKVEIPSTTWNQTGIYRICSITGTFSHQPVTMPGSEKGPQDDCIRIKVNGV